MVHLLTLQMLTMNATSGRLRDIYIYISIEYWYRLSVSAKIFGSDNGIGCESGFIPYLILLYHVNAMAEIRCSSPNQITKEAYMFEATLEIQIGIQHVLFFQFPFKLATKNPLHSVLAKVSKDRKKINSAASISGGNKSLPIVGSLIFETPDNHFLVALGA